MAGTVGGSAGTLRPALALARRHAAERPLIDLAVLGARERYAPVLEFVDGLGRVAHHIFDGVLIAKPVRPLDGVVHMPAPVIFVHVAERRRDAALRRDGVRARRKYFGDAGGTQPGFAAADYRTQARAAGADHDDIIGMVFDRIGVTVGGGTTPAICGLAVAISRHGLHSR